MILRPVDLGKRVGVDLVISGAKADHEAVDAGPDQFLEALLCILLQVNLIAVLLIYLVFDGRLELRDDIEDVVARIDDVYTLHLNVVTHGLLW